MNPTLAQVSVIELGGGHASAYAGRVLAGFGADVTTLELAGAPHPAATGIRATALREFLAMGKKHREVAATEIPALLADADILLVGDDLPTIGRWDLDLDEVAARFPGLTITSITPFGRSGPWAHKPATELTLQALGGLLAMSGSAEREPLMRSLQQSKYTTGLNAAYTSLASVYAAADHGAGTVIDIAQREVIASELVLNEPTYAYVGAVQGRLPESKDIFFTGAPVHAADGLVTMQINNRTGVQSFAGLLDEPRLADERFATAEGRLRHAAELTGLVEDALASWQGRAFFEAAAEHGLLAGFVQTADSLLNCPQLAARGVWSQLNVEGTDLQVPGQMVNITRFSEQEHNINSDVEVLV